MYILLFNSFIKFRAKICMNSEISNESHRGLLFMFTLYTLHYRRTLLLRCHSFETFGYWYKSF